MRKLRYREVWHEDISEPNTNNLKNTTDIVSESYSRYDSYAKANESGLLFVCMGNCKYATVRTDHIFDEFMNFKRFLRD